MSSSHVSVVGVAGAGTMGLGIAQVSAMSGLETVILEPFEEARDAAIGRIKDSLEGGAARGKWTSEEARAAIGRIRTSAEATGLRDCDLVIEAAPESLDLKHRLFDEIAGATGPETILATNTSSLSVTAIASRIDRPERVLGLHFFNPAPIMRLVEVVSGLATAPEIAERARETIDRMGKVTIMAADSIGFVANRCARPYTIEGIRIAEDRNLEPAEIDRICRVAGGFPMGPFELIDLVGADINLAVARSFFEQGFGLARWRPSLLQVRQVDAGRLGRKTGRGFYDYGNKRYRDPDPELDLVRPVIDRRQQAEVAGENAPEVLDRISAQIVNEAVFALGQRVASEEDIDIAMRNGLNWPIGPLEWGRQLGPDRVAAVLEDLKGRHGDAYLTAPGLHEALSN